MDIKYLKEYREKISLLSEEEKRKRDLYLKGLADGTIYGPLTGVPSIDKVWLKYYRDEKIDQSLPCMSMYDYMIHCNTDNMNSTAITYYGNKISYKKLVEKIDETAKAFVKMGVKKGDVVSVAMPSMPETIYSIYALNKIGATINMVDPRVPTDKIKDYINMSNSKFLVVIDKCYPKINDLIDDTKLKKTVFVSPFESLPAFLREIKKSIDAGYKNYKKNLSFRDSYVDFVSFIKDGKDVFVPKAEYEERMDSVIIYTSGTSGEPKGAVSSNEAFNNMAYFQADSIVNVKVGDKFLLIMPPFIAYGLAIGIHGQLCTGQNLVMIPTFNIDNQAEMLGNLVKKHKPQTIMGVPAFMVDLIKHPSMQKLDCSFLKNVIVGGDGMIPDLEAEVDKFLTSHGSSARVTKGYGMTEVNSCSTYTRDFRCNENGSVGIPLVGDNFRILKPMVDEDGEALELVDFNIDDYEELSYDEVGEIFMLCPTVINDYLNNEKASSKVFFTTNTGDKWVRSEDLGRMDKNGNIFIDGRMKRIIIRPDGHNVSPFAIEEIINRHPKVHASAVVGRPSDNHEHGSYPVAYVVLKDEFKDDYEEVIEELKTEIESKLPTRDIANFYEQTDEIPLTNIGKVDYKSLEAKEKAMVLQRTRK